MKLLATIALALAAAAVHAQAPDVGAERERIERERAAADARFAEAQKACRGKFAVNDCIEKASRERNAVVSELKRQQLVIKDAERKRNAAARQKEIDERSSPEQQQRAADQRAKALADQKGREAQAAEKAAKRAAEEAKREQRGPRTPKAAHGESGPQGSPRAPQAAASHGPSAGEAAKNRAEYEKRLTEAEQHKAEVVARKAKRTKPVAADLPPPPRP
jgi:hypothetical protein